jgi:hypothetical protein
MSVRNAQRHRNLSRFRRDLERFEDRTAPAVIAWDGGPTGNGTDWLVAENWDYVDSFGVHHDVLPGADDDVTIGSTGSDPTINLGGTGEVHIVSSTRALVISGTLSVQGPASSLSALTVLGTLKTTGTVTVTGPTAIDGATIAVARLEAQGGLVMDNGGTISGGVLVNTGAATISAKNYTLGNGADGSYFLASGGMFENRGTLTVQDNVGFVQGAGPAGLFRNEGTLTVAGPIGATIRVPVDSSGPISVLGGGFNVGGREVPGSNSSFSGPINVAPGSILAFIGSG